MRARTARANVLDGAGDARCGRACRASLDRLPPALRRNHVVLAARPCRGLIALPGQRVRRRPRPRVRAVRRTPTTSKKLYKLIGIIAIIVFVVVEGALLWALFKFKAKKGARRRPDPRQHAPGDRLDRRRRRDPDLPHRLHLHQAAGHQEPAAGPARTGCSSPRRRCTPPRTSRAARRRRAATSSSTASSTSGATSTPGQDGVFSYTEMVVPVDTTVMLDITADDVNHSWWIPKLGGKMDAIPGYTNHTWFKAPRRAPTAASAPSSAAATTRTCSPR